MLQLLISVGSLRDCSTELKNFVPPLRVNLVVQNINVF